MSNLTNKGIPLIKHSSNPDCPACMDNKEHTEEEMRKYHPLAGHGYNNEQKWTHPEAKRLHDLEQKEREELKGTRNIKK